MRTDDLDLEIDPTFEKAMHRAQRIGWVLLAVFLLLAALGVFGQSELSMKQITLPQGSFKYSRFARMSAPTLIIAQLDSSHRLWISQDFIEKVRVQFVTPIPVKTVTRDGGIELQFEATDAATPITIELRPNTVGTISGKFGIGDSDRIAFSQFSYF